MRGKAIGGWGGQCTCPDGEKFTVGHDHGSKCTTFNNSCIGGIAGGCTQSKNGAWSFMKVVCGPAKKVYTENYYQQNIPGAGYWGGECTCPDGQKYWVADHYRGNCKNMAYSCVGGTPGKCNKVKDAKWARNQVICGHEDTGEEKHKNKVLYNVPGVTGWGGQCTCPDGQKYWVGDNKNYCATIACIGGISGECHKKNLAKWAGGKKVICGEAPKDKVDDMRRLQKLQKKHLRKLQA